MIKELEYQRKSNVLEELSIYKGKERGEKGIVTDKFAENRGINIILCQMCRFLAAKLA